MAFDHLKNLEVRERVARMDLPEMFPGAWIEGRPANESNKPYFNALLKRAGKSVRKMGRAGRISPEQLVENRGHDRELFPVFVFTGWNLRDESNEPVKHSLETAQEFCQKCPHWLFDRIREFFSLPESFLDDVEDLPDAEDVLGNSPSGSSGS